MNRNVAMAALGAAVLLIAGALVWSSSEPTAPEPTGPEPEAAATAAPPSAPPVAPQRPEIGVIELTPEQRQERAAIVREQIRKLTAEQKAKLRGDLPDQQSTSGPADGQAGPVTPPE